MDTVHSELSMPQVFGRMKPDEAWSKWVDSPSDFVNLEETPPQIPWSSDISGNPSKIPWSIWNESSVSSRFMTKNRGAPNVQTPKIWPTKTGFYPSEQNLVTSHVVNDHEWNTPQKDHRPQKIWALEVVPGWLGCEVPSCCVDSNHATYNPAIFGNSLEHFYMYTYIHT